ncbi:sensor histidine kinase [Numidum massiliense]|uniref:sensor histidine kinase n=1 Tax=Numidum massiliense TaxID=1522315 RepID=UPI0006D5418A|nr:HAMP domain-containing sensor histidine kinase [Numidum massiliense]
MKTKWRYLKWPFYPVKLFHRTTRFLAQRVHSSLRIQLILVFIACTVFTIVTTVLFYNFFGETTKDIPIYIESSADLVAYDLAPELQAELVQGMSAQQFIAAKEQVDEYKDYQLMVVGVDGKVLHKSQNAQQKTVKIDELIKRSNAKNSHFTTNAPEDDVDDGSYVEEAGDDDEQKENDDQTEVADSDRANVGDRPETGGHKAISDEEQVAVVPLSLNGEAAYFVVRGYAIHELSYQTITSINPLTYVVPFVSFISLFYLLTQRKIRYIAELARGLRTVAAGNLNYRVAYKSTDELGMLATSINHMTTELERTIAEERRAENTKTELITNVSHDLRTPLTIIMGYLRLLKDKEYKDEQQLESFIDVAFRKSENLKVLIDDLFEYTKLSNKGTPLKLEAVYLNDLLEQLLAELASYAEENTLTFHTQLPQEKLMVTVDADKISRVFENLLTNAIKYSVKPSAIRTTMAQRDNAVTVTISNKSKPLSQEQLTRMFERFYRVDSARTSEAGGSGLGLAIAKSIVDLHDGNIWAESDGDIVHITVRLPLRYAPDGAPTRYDTRP